jgi:hypothetical protein
MLTFDRHEMFEAIVLIFVKTWWRREL